MLTLAGKAMIAASTYYKGKAFFGAALLLRQRGGNEWVVRHLVGQSIELMCKAMLLAADFDGYRIKLAKPPYGHNLVKLVAEARGAYGLHELDRETSGELAAFNKSYAGHTLRYGGIIDLFHIPSTVPVERLIRKCGITLHVIERRRLFNSSGEAAWVGG